MLGNPKLCGYYLVLMYPRNLYYYNILYKNDVSLQSEVVLVAVKILRYTPRPTHSAQPYTRTRTHTHVCNSAHTQHTHTHTHTPAAAAAASQPKCVSHLQTLTHGSDGERRRRGTKCLTAQSSSIDHFFFRNMHI